MTKHATVIRYNKGLKQADEKIVELLDRYKNVNLSDKSQWANTSFAFARQLKTCWNSLAPWCRERCCATSLAARTTSRLPRSQRREVPQDHQGQLHRDIAGPRFEYEEVDTQFIKPRPRRYDATK